MAHTPTDPAELLRALEQSRAEAHGLREELEETNRGVLALYAELDTQADQLREATALKSRFLAYMSHEFRTPINAISPAWFEMVDLFSALRGMFKPVLTNPDVNLVFEEPHGVPKLFTDNRKLSQILRNFISNALKFTPKGEVRVGAVCEGDSVTFSVSDTGIGIDPKFHQSIFEDFAQVKSPLQKRLRGTGLGLALSKRLAGVLGGTVQMQSAPGAGSTFSLTIPVRLEAPADADG